MRKKTKPTVRVINRHTFQVNGKTIIRYKLGNWIRQFGKYTREEERIIRMQINQIDPEYFELKKEETQGIPLVSHGWAARLLSMK